MLKVAIVGCGKIADSHAAAIERIRGCEIAGVCDREILMARQLHSRFPVRQYFSDIDEMLSEARPDVVHITTPPESHFAIAKHCLQAGCHVYVEKPFTVYEEEARKLISLANLRGLKITVGHDDQFTRASRRMRTAIQSGFLGRGPVHMESYYCYELGKTAYAGALLGDKRHWVRRLPGKLLQNVISHGLARIAEYLTGDDLHVIAHGFTSPLLRSMGEREIVDELRVIISEGKRTTAYFTFSSQMRPSLHQFRIYGPENGLLLDRDHETVIALDGKKYKSYLEYWIPPVTMAKQYLSNARTNIRQFLARDFQMKAGLLYLVDGFYSAIRYGTPLPISYREILLTAKIMDEIFWQLNTDTSDVRCQTASVAFSN